MNPRVLVGIFVTPFLMTILSSCGMRAAGYGVVLWGEQAGAPATGSVITIVRDSAIGSVYLVSLPGVKGLREFPKSRIRLFRKKAEASAFAGTYSSLASTWGFSRKQDQNPLPIREKASQESKVIYNLRSGQVVKIVGKSERKAKVNPYEDYWYEVVTGDGFAGYCFGHFLKVFDTQGDPEEEARRLMSQDETLDRIMGNVWRPDWFREMVAKNTIDLSVFREEVGLFPSPSENLVRLVLPLSRFDFGYTGIEKLGANAYVFTGSDLRINVLDQERITVSYQIKGQPVTGMYALMEEDVAEVIAREQKRRQDLFDQFVAAGATLASSAYGTIRFEEGMRFTWQGFGKLVPSLIGVDAKGGGRIDFPYHLSKELAGAQDGVITFVFDEYPDTAAASFLFKNVSGGVRFTSVAKAGISDLVVTQAGFSPVVIFFSRSP